MSSIICNNQQCKFCSPSRFCKQILVSLTAAGQCKIWWNENCQPRLVPKYPVEEEEEIQEEHE